MPDRRPLVARGASDELGAIAAEEEKKAAGAGASGQHRPLTKEYSINLHQQVYTKFDNQNQAELVFPNEGQNATVKLNDFFITHILGMGAFGKVYRGELARRK